MKNSVKIDLLKTIIAHYPVVSSILVHSAGREKCLSGSQRLRELKQKGLMYSYKDHEYNFEQTPPLIIHGMLRELMS